MFSLKINDELELALPSTANIERAFAAVMANYDHLYKWSSWLNEDFSREDIREFYERALLKFEKGEDEIVLNIILKGQLVGVTGFHQINRKNKSAEIGYWLVKNETGKGLVTKSVVRLLDYGFDEMGLNRIVIKCVPENTKSRAVPERLSFVQEGIERQSGWLHTRFVDHVVYSMLANEWNEKKLKIKGKIKE